MLNASTLSASTTFPAPPRLEAAMPPFASPLRLESDAAADDLFTLAGRRALASGGTGRGVDELRIHPRCVLRGLRLEGAASRGGAVTPIGVERRLEVDGRAVTERVLVCRDLPAALLEWAAPEGAALALSWRTELERGGAPPRWRREGASLLVARGEPGDLAYFALSTEPAAWEVEEADAGTAPEVRCRVRLHLPPGGSVRLAVAGTARGAEDLGTTLAALRPDTAAYGRAGALRRLRDGRIAVSAPDPLAGTALEWAKSRLDGDLVEGPGLGGRAARDAVWTALASLAVGDFEAARELIRILGDPGASSGRVPREATTSGGAGTGAGGAACRAAADDAPLYLLLVARYLAWSGDLGFLKAQWERVRGAYARLEDEMDGGPGAAGSGSPPAGASAACGAALRTAALAELAVAAESIGERALAEELRGREKRSRPALEGAEAWPDALRDAAARSPNPGWLGWAALAGGRSEEGFGHWWSHVEQGFRGAQGAWAGAQGSGDACPDRALATALVVSPLVYGVLGAEPDAPRHRLRLRPQLPAAWAHLEVARLRMGEATLALRYRREGDRHTFRLEQESGGVPVRVVFEPLLAARRLVAARVDGQAAADLDPRPFGERMLVPIQVVLDHERTIEIEVAHDAAARPAGLRVWRQ